MGRFKSSLALAIVMLAAACGRAPESTAPATTPATAPAATNASQPTTLEAGEEAGSVTADLSVSVASVQYSLKAMGQCTYTEKAAIYKVPAAMWHTMVHADGQPLSYANLTVWEFKDHSTQASLGLQVRGEFRHVSTVKGATLVGSGTARAAHEGEGARLSFDGTDNRGDAVHVEVRCPKATVPIEEGGR